jgi:hypothetical protein|tara:strand:+ start:2807 stop:3064 length:258 start_codon:yes stop_codon:yes gene_type:complete
MITSKYVILETSDITSEDSNVDFTKLNNTRADMLRKNVDGTKAIVKYNGNKPGFLYGKTAYSHREILKIVNDPDGEWWVEIETPS